MSFNIALSGINAAQKDLNTTANNIANVNTTGFKESRAEFGDVYATSIFSNAKTSVGNGVATAHVAQQFQQGSLNFTENSLDLAINGNGFFVMSDGLESMDRNYTRAGAFKLDSNSFVTNSAGNYLQVYDVNDDGSPKAVSMASTKPLQIPDTAGVPESTSNVDMTMNLPATSPVLDPTKFDPADSTTFTSATSVSIYDSLGESHTLSTYYIKDGTAGAPANSWLEFNYVDDQPIDIVGGQAVAAAPGTPAKPAALRLTFDSSGLLQQQLPAIAETVPLGAILTNGADTTQTVKININNPTQFASAFEVTKLEQDGATVGRLTGIDIGPDGMVAASYSNGRNDKLGMIAMAKFANEQGLSQTGDTGWRASQLSGNAIAGEANSGTFGKINSSALEQSNVNLTSELVDLITAQRNYQANSRTLEVNSKLQDTVLQIR
ncbi:flagellar hook protein FlgE [Moritella sp. F3]|uniref:flagellar hook protein FlgE n=1 Tax=Moritella sp. F3 TaxID=2718882 RepID=UPI0018E12791|nr:flagellar hook protein FlgE [Moritella sp. F3]GIC76609.1 flagellar hook protein FlgE [Moritella sp. F1]GIC81638.1 flagellar hook protein FlgE [Moritella sp. F3]